MFRNRPSSATLRHTAYLSHRVGFASLVGFTVSHSFRSIRSVGQSGPPARPVAPPPRPDAAYRRFRRLVWRYPCSDPNKGAVNAYRTAPLRPPAPHPPTPEGCDGLKFAPAQFRPVAGISPCVAVGSPLGLLSAASSVGRPCFAWSIVGHLGGRYFCSSPRYQSEVLLNFTHSEGLFAFFNSSAPWEIPIGWAVV